MNYLKNVKILMFVILIGSIGFVFYSCSKEKMNPETSVNTENEVSVSSKIMKFNSFDEYLETKIKVLQMTFEELHAFEESRGFISQGRVEDEFYYSIDPESFQNIDEVREFVAENSIFIKLVNDEYGEYEVVTLQNENSDKYFMNKDGIFQIGRRLYKVLDFTTKLSTNNENYNELKEFSIDNYSSKLSSDFIVSKSERMRYEDANNLVLKHALDDCGKDFRKLQTNGNNRTELTGWIWYSHDYDIFGVPMTILYNMVQIKNQKRSGAWFNASRTTTYDLAIAYDTENEDDPEIVYRSGVKKFAKKQIDFGSGVISLGFHSTLPLKYAGYDCYVKTPSISAINKECNASLF